MRRRALPVVVLVAGFVALVGSGAWAMNRQEPSGSGWMGHNASGWMMGNLSGATNPVRSIAAARERAQSFAGRHDLRVAEVIEFTNNYYARLDDKSGKPATEVLVDPSTGNTSLEYGPAMMWNTRYGMMNGRFRTGMMGGAMRSGSGMGSPAGGTNGDQMMGSTDGAMWTPASGSANGPKSAQQAVAVADRWLAKRDPSLSVPDADAFPGYYTMEIKRHGKIVGMLSINASSGVIWNHWWHGDFVAISD